MLLNATILFILFISITPSLIAYPFSLKFGSLNKNREGIVFIAAMMLLKAAKSFKIEFFMKTFPLNTLSSLPFA